MTGRTQADPEDAPGRAHAAATHYEQVYHGCSQCTLAALQDAFDRRDDAVFRAATALSGGGGLCGDGSCGAYAGAVLFFGQVAGRTRDDFADPGRVRDRSAAAAAALHDRFVERYGSVVCREVQAAVIGRAYDLTDPDDVARFREAGAHEVHCPEVAGLAARWAAEIVLDAGMD